jgi:hypothetical protein
MEEWRYNSTMYDFCTRWGRIVRFTFQAAYPRGNRVWQPSERRLDGL